MDYGISESASDDGKIRLLTMGNIKQGVVEVPRSGGVDYVDDYLLIEPGDLLFNRTNSAELVGKVGLFQGSRSPVTFASYLVRMRPTQENEPKYMNYVLNGPLMLQVARREAIPSLHQSNLNPTRYGRLPIALPPHAEQVSIVHHLENVTTNLDKAISDAQREISLLREYRTRLIADVVTGKLDVRETVAELPDEAEEPVAPDEAEMLVEGEDAGDEALEAVEAEVGA
jgi:type I restriction enzyme S subunit